MMLVLLLMQVLLHVILLLVLLHGVQIIDLLNQMTLVSPLFAFGLLWLADRKGEYF